MEQCATITEAPTRTILLHVVPVKVIAPSGSSLTTYALLQQEHCEQSGFKRTATACVREHCCREKERTFPIARNRGHFAPVINCQRNLIFKMADDRAQKPLIG